jgi:hypothetical protein
MDQSDNLVVSADDSSGQNACRGFDPAGFQLPMVDPLCQGDFLFFTRFPTGKIRVGPCSLFTMDAGSHSAGNVGE